LAHLVADLDANVLHRAGGGRGHFHRRLVAFERDERVVLLHAVARLHQHFDHRHVLEVADVGNLHFDRGHLLSSLLVLLALLIVGQTIPGAGLSASMPYLRIASAAFATGISPSSASARSAAIAT